MHDNHPVQRVTRINLSLPHALQGINSVTGNVCLLLQALATDSSLCPNVKCRQTSNVILCCI